MKVKKYGRLSLKERVIIETLLQENKTQTYIAKRLKRSRSTVFRELKKWVQSPTDIYDAKLADWAAKDDYLNKMNIPVIGYSGSNSATLKDQVTCLSHQKIEIWQKNLIQWI